MSPFRHVVLFAASVCGVFASTPAAADVEFGVGQGEVFARSEVLGFENARGSLRAPEASPTFLLSGNLDLRIVRPLIADRLGLAGAIDLELGFAAPAGFVHGIHIQPLGVGLVLGRMGVLAVSAGAGVGGITARVPTALEVPASARLAFDATDHVRLLVDARILWAFAKVREDGAPYAPFGDEMRLGIGARIGHIWSQGRAVDGGGYFFRLEHTERLGSTYVGIAIGWELGARY